MKYRELVDCVRDILIDLTPDEYVTVASIQTRMRIGGTDFCALPVYETIPTRNRIQVALDELVDGREAARYELSEDTVVYKYVG